ncbi:hypothetical protein ASPCAL13370 [Aspergillus calidoustus]|uniref:Uncharacterized protein n=1 Tax=Aspergillus calidoustus TaxID=454130 RepID=A0A0U5GHA6_ASPCI|nr:hypothetical protein ASPCAL13370 [Aspergillus calidoustus]
MKMTQVAYKWDCGLCLCTAHLCQSQLRPKDSTKVDCDHGQCIIFRPCTGLCYCTKNILAHQRRRTFTPIATGLCNQYEVVCISSSLNSSKT